MLFEVWGFPPSPCLFPRQRPRLTSVFTTLTLKEVSLRLAVVARLGAAGLTTLVCAAGLPGLTAGASTCREDSLCWTSGTSSPKASTSS